nr:integrase, catalytic region, zinc finger, CCHC-type, peptidase aspartic, catalytic [Tanacetum cinerariifolium]
MLEKSLYDSWKSHMELYIENQENERMILNSFQNGPLVRPTVVEEGVKLEQRNSGLAVPLFNQGDDPIAYLNKTMAFLTAVASSRNAAWFKEKAMLAEAQEFGQILDEEQLAFLVDPGIPDDQATQTTIPNTAAFQTEDLDAYDSDCDDVSNAKAVLMANLSNYGSDVISEESLALKQQIDSLEQNLSNQIKEKESLFQTFTVFKNKSKEKESKYMDKEIDLEKKIKELDNIVYKVGQSAQKKAQRIKPTLYDGSVISSQRFASHVIDDEETLILEEVSRSKMRAKQNNPMSKEKKVNTTPINYVELNRLSKDFGKHFVPQQELSDEQAFWLQTSHPNTNQSASSPVKIEALKELPKGYNATDVHLLLLFSKTGTVRFGNDQIAKIMRYGDYQLGNVIISRVYYVEGLGHNLFYVGQFCDADLEVAFWKNTCFIHNLEGVDLLSGSIDINLYTISLNDMLKTSPICLLSKASNTKSWLWHRRLSHLNFATLNKLAKDGLARSIPKLKF